jgi:hypothetical protein
MNFTNRLKDVASKFVEIEHTVPAREASQTGEARGNTEGVGPETHSFAPTGGQHTRTVVHTSESPEDIRGRYLAQLEHLALRTSEEENAGYALRFLTGLPVGMSYQGRQNALRASLKARMQETGGSMETLFVEVASRRADYVEEKEKNLMALEQEVAECQHLLREMSEHVQILLTVRREMEMQTETRVQHLDMLVHLLSEEF